MPGALPPEVEPCLEGDPSLLPVDEAYRRIATLVSPIAERDRIPLRAALGRVLAHEVVASLDVPGHTNSAVDGYALAGDDLPAQASRNFRVRGSVMAGQRFPGPLAAGECVRVMTGAAMPEGSDTVIMLEHVQIDGDEVRVAAGHRGGQNVRQAGEDIRRGGSVLRSGRRLTPADLGLLASVGIAEVTVVRRPRVSFFSTGDELRSLGETLQPGQVYDSNRYTMLGMLTRLGVAVQDLGVVRDNPVQLRDALRRAAAGSDLVLTSGGVSTGDADHVKGILDELGQVGFWRIAVRPGRPLAFGRLQQALFFGLPGNPVAVMVTFYQFVQPALRRLEGEHDDAPTPLLEARCTVGLRKKPGRVEYFRAVLGRDERGELAVQPTGKTGSGLLHTMSDANCFIILPHSGTSTAPGDRVLVQPFHGLI
jgi:molybdopterin molybdotransferase